MIPNPLMSLFIAGLFISVAASGSSPVCVDAPVPIDLIGSSFEGQEMAIGPRGFISGTGYHTTDPELGSDYFSYVPYYEYEYNSLTFHGGDQWCFDSSVFDPKAFRASRGKAGARNVFAHHCGYRVYRPRRMNEKSIESKYWNRETAMIDGEPTLLPNGDKRFKFLTIGTLTFWPKERKLHVYSVLKPLMVKTYRVDYEAIYLRVQEMSDQDYVRYIITAERDYLGIKGHHIHEFYGRIVVEASRRASTDLRSRVMQDYMQGKLPKPLNMADSRVQKLGCSGKTVLQIETAFLKK